MDKIPNHLIFSVKNIYNNTTLIGVQKYILGMVFIIKIIIIINNWIIVYSTIINFVKSWFTISLIQRGK